jgi:carboxylesterase type B
MYSYRLGFTGFATSEELRKAGYKANNGFHDQRTAMQWIKKFIGGFGGDPDEITVCGESAGGCRCAVTLMEALTNACSVCDNIAVLKRAAHEALS